MAKPVSDNIEMLLRVVRRLAPLLDRFIFLGGAVTELLISDTGAPGARQTKDYDLVIDGRREIVADLANAPPDLRAYVADRLSQLLARTDASILIAAHVMPDSASQDRLPIVVDRIRDLISAAGAH